MWHSMWTRDIFSVNIYMYKGGVNRNVCYRHMRSAGSTHPATFRLTDWQIDAWKSWTICFRKLIKNTTKNFGLFNIGNVIFQWFSINSDVKSWKKIHPRWKFPYQENTTLRTYLKKNPCGAFLLCVNPSIEILNSPGSTRPVTVTYVSIDAALRINKLLKLPMICVESEGWTSWMNTY